MADGPGKPDDAQIGKKIEQATTARADITTARSPTVAGEIRTAAHETAHLKVLQSASSKAKGLNQMPSKLDTKLTPTFNKAASPPAPPKTPTAQLNYSPPEPSPSGTSTSAEIPPSDDAKKKEAEAFKAKLLIKTKDDRTLTKKFNERSRDR